MVDPKALLCLINEAVFEFYRASVASVPSPNHIRVWVDAAYKEATTMVALVARDNHSNILLLASKKSKKVHASSALEAELAVEFGILSRLKQGWRDAILFSDAQLVTSAVSLRLAPKWEFTFI
ncbi:hypothetical protein TorRG33x02_045070 [Trema orientale]|uniref:RNase H type-1 domain-containing protein n=1 Tax=Trema orientale TaxID=63057 RepID=A0A2P5FPL1_TREOI|nr:hypothetical protein TorRG33x02_045070 [Trema orientale]